MKIQYILILFVLISCSQNKKEKKETIVKAKDRVDVVIESPEKVDDVSFNKIISELKTKNIPLIDSTNFDNFKEESFYSKPEVTTLKLEKIYPNYYNEGGYNHRAMPNYKIKYSDNFHSVVITIYKGDSEMESRLINYDFKGNILDSKIISYDEMAEGWSKIESSIDKNKLSVTKITWYDDRVEEKEHY